MVNVDPHPEKNYATVTFANHEDANRAREHGTRIHDSNVSIFWDKFNKVLSVLSFRASHKLIQGSTL